MVLLELGDLSLGPAMVAVRFDADRPYTARWIIGAQANLDGVLHQRPQRAAQFIRCHWRGRSSQKLDHMVPLKGGHALVAVFDTEPVNDVAAAILTGRARTLESRTGEIGHGQGAKGAWSGAFRADWHRLSGQCLFVGRH